MLKEHQEKINKQISNAFKEIEKGYKYCPQCKEYYKKKAFESELKKEKREICTYKDPVQWSENEYENRICTIEYSVCPMGHKIEENVSY